MAGTGGGAHQVTAAGTGGSARCGAGSRRRPVVSAAEVAGSRSSVDAESVEAHSSPGEAGRQAARRVVAGRREACGH